MCIEKVEPSDRRTGALFTDETNACFADLAGPGAGSDYFDWGLPFFYGRGVFYAIEGASVEGGQTPFVAY